MVGNEGSDCTAPYDVELDKDYTVKEFIEAVLSLTTEWGCISLKDERHILKRYAICEYKYGKIVKTYCIPGEIMDKKVISVKAHGGWSAMDYYIKVNENELEDDLSKKIDNYLHKLNSSEFLITSKLEPRTGMVILSVNKNGESAEKRMSLNSFGDNSMFYKTLKILVNEFECGVKRRRT